MQTKIIETDIIFSKRVPVLGVVEYQLYRVTPVPINKPLLLITPKFVAISNDKISFFNKKCYRFKEVYICEGEELGVAAKGEECLFKILKNNSPN